MVNVKFWCLSVMNKTTEQSLRKVLIFVNRAIRRVGVGFAVAALSAGVASASSLDTLETFLKTTKSGRADLQSGGMGALINITTTRPLNSPGLKAVLGGKAVYDDSSALKDDLTPEVSGLFSNTFADASKNKSTHYVISSAGSGVLPSSSHFK